MTTHDTNINATSTRIPMTNPAMVALWAEGKVVHSLIARIEPWVTAVQEANPDLAIAMWCRFREVVVEANGLLSTEMASITSLAKKDAVRIEPEALDGVIASLPVHAGLLHAIGRFRAAAFITNSFHTARVLSHSPTAQMRIVLAAVQTHHATLLDQMKKLVDAELAAYAEATGRRAPAGTVQVVPSTTPGASTIVIEHS